MSEKKPRRYCRMCGRNVYCKPKMNIGILLFLLFCLVIPGIIYWAMTKNDYECPLCGAPMEDLDPAKEDSD